MYKMKRMTETIRCGVDMNRKGKLVTYEIREDIKRDTFEKIGRIKRHINIALLKFWPA